MTTKELRKTIKDRFGSDSSVSGDSEDEGWTIKTHDYVKARDFITKDLGLVLVNHEIVGPKFGFKHSFWVYPKDPEPTTEVRS